MADQVANGRSSLSSEDVIVRAVQFFTSEKWRATTQSAKLVTFEGRPPIPIVSILVAIIFIWTVIVPIIMYFMVIRKLMQFQNLVVTANSLTKGTEVIITYPKRSTKMVDRFLGVLPK